MEAVRCTECGETRWSLFPGSLAHALEAPCELCGGETVVERRRPGAGPTPLGVERRRRRDGRPRSRAARAASAHAPRGALSGADDRAAAPAAVHAADHDAIHADLRRPGGHALRRPRPAPHARRDGGGAAHLRRRARPPRLLVPRRDRARRRRAVGDGGLHPLGGHRARTSSSATRSRAAPGAGATRPSCGSALVDHAFGPLGVPRVVAQVEPANIASRHVLEKLGMREREERTAYGRPHLLYVLDGYAARCAARVAAAVKPASSVSASAARPLTSSAAVAPSGPSAAIQASSAPVTTASAVALGALGDRHVAARREEPEDAVVVSPRQHAGRRCRSTSAGVDAARARAGRSRRC